MTYQFVNTGVAWLGYYDDSTCSGPPIFATAVDLADYGCQSHSYSTEFEGACLDETNQLHLCLYSDSACSQLVSTEAIPSCEAISSANSSYTSYTGAGVFAIGYDYVADGEATCASIGLTDFNPTTMTLPWSSTSWSQCTGHDDCSGDSYCDVYEECWTPCSACGLYDDAIDGVCPPCVNSTWTSTWTPTTWTTWSTTTTACEQEYDECDYLVNASTYQACPVENFTDFLSDYCSGGSCKQLVDAYDACVNTTECLISPIYDDWCDTTNGTTTTTTTTNTTNGAAYCINADYFPSISSANLAQPTLVGAITMFMLLA
jgi:hypothetical protein